MFGLGMVVERDSLVSLELALPEAMCMMMMWRKERCVWLMERAHSGGTHATAAAIPIQ
jgi:hypothetical protein